MANELVSYNFAKCCKTHVFCTFCLANVLRATAACHFWTSELQKVARECGGTFWLKNVLRATAVFWIGTSKMAPALRCFVHFDLQMCFAPQRRAIFEHRNFKNGSAIVVFCAFWLTNALRATAPCHFSPVCWTATSAPAALARLLFGHQEARIIEKTQRFATSLTFRARVASF